jgi:septal ring factor EnvC (AmiA/AmiB activator)
MKLYKYHRCGGDEPVTKHELRKLKDINKEIEILKKQLNNIQVEADMISDTVKGSSPYFPYVEHSIKVTGVDVAGYERKVARIRGAIVKKLHEALDKRNEILEYIEAVEDIEIRNILTLRYSECMTWEEIENMLHMHKRTAQRKFRKWWDEN